MPNNRKDRGAHAARHVTLLVFILWLGGCEGPDTGPPIKQEDAAKIKAGMTLAEIETILGPSRAAAREHTARLDEVFSRIPSQPGGGRPTDTGTDHAWGNSQAWLAARVRADGHAGLVVSQFGGAPPPSPPPPPDAPKVYFRDYSPRPGG